MDEQKTKDLENGFENGFEIYGEEEIQLLEDRRARKLIYFVSWYFFKEIWVCNIIPPIFSVVSAGCAWCSYFGLRNIYYETKMLEPFPFLWLTIHYFLAFVLHFLDYIDIRKNPILEKKILRKLEEVSEADLIGGLVTWRKIAFNVNQCFVKKKYNSSIFYGREQCRRFFVKEVVIPVGSGSYDIRTCYNGNIYRDYCKNSSNKKLAQEAAANYNKSIKNHDEVSHMDEEIENNIGILEKFHIISAFSILCLLSIEMAFCMIMCLAAVGLALYRAIFT